MYPASRRASREEYLGYVVQQRERQLREALDKLDGAGDVLGRICVLGTLEHGENPVHDEISRHASVRAIMNQIERAEYAERRLAEVEAIAREYRAWPDDTSETRWLNEILADWDRLLPPAPTEAP